MVTPPHRHVAWIDPTPQRALVIEADPERRHWVAGILRDEGYEVTELNAAFGVHALARRMAPAVIVLDLDLPYRSGLSLLPQLKADPQTASIPIIVQTSTPDLIPPSRRHLVAALLLKPCDEHTLRTAIRTSGRAASPGAPGFALERAAKSRQQGALPHDVTGDQIPRRDVRVLVVDDDPGVTDVMAMALQNDGYAVEIAPDGAVALGLLAARYPEVPAVILLDMKMPVMDGATFARHYRCTPAPHAPLICLTAADRASEQCHEIGADGFLGKPFSLSDLRALVHRHANPAA